MRITRLAAAEQSGPLLKVRLQRMANRRTSRTTRERDDEGSFGAFERHALETQTAPRRTPPRPMAERKR